MHTSTIFPLLNNQKQLDLERLEKLPSDILLKIFKLMLRFVF